MREITAGPSSPLGKRDPWVHKSGARLTTKEMPVRILKKAWCKDIPPVLAGIGSSQHHGRRTFTEIIHWGNLKAIDYVLGRYEDRTTFEADHWNLKSQGPAQLLECLGSTELETLVRKLFEAKGCHVPAYLGGTLRDIDIFAHNDTREPIEVGDVRIPAGGRISIQVKTWSAKPRSAAVDYLIGLDPPAGKGTFGPDWLLNRIKETPSVLAWMQRSLNWLPKQLLQKFDL